MDNKAFARHFWYVMASSGQRGMRNPVIRRIDVELIRLAARYKQNSHDIAEPSFFR
ncbi:hypothetical protein [Paraburkholderia terrae]|uniref:hypothetical protein n=1 Tax=Paraburkholderia terrae TaxID=311230 RepID=UPI001E3D00C6|nr:hypothetical protein [Paraburkholderia terrae]